MANDQVSQSEHWRNRMTWDDDYTGFLVEVHFGTVEHTGPYATIEEAAAAVKEFDVEVAKRTDREWWSDEAVGEQKPSANIIRLRPGSPTERLREQLASWELPI